MLQRVGVPALTVVTVLSSTVFGLARPAAGDAISDAKAKAAAIEAQLSQAQNEMSALSQQYDEAQYHLSQINSNIQTTKANITSDQNQVSKDKDTLAKAAVANYITDGTASTQNSIFSGNQETLGATSEYNQIAEGDISLSVDKLHTAENQLNAQEAQLNTEQGQAQTQVNAEQAAVAQNQQAIDSQKNALSQEQGQIAQLVQQQQQAEAAAAAQAAKQRQAAAAAAAAAQAQSSNSGGGGGGGGGGGSQLAGLSQAAPPPTAPGGAGAVQAAESQIGVPYVWGGESPKGSASPGFDCSGLTAWSWGQVGVGLPHYSGAQMADSTPVPVSDLQPGDLLFYGPGGSDHVAMYVGPGEMIEAPYTGASVWITALRLGNGFVGAGRP
ncbi:MAG TPA: NlpC/P60 family protein [Acidimicrobiales bacterium]|jgi:cell wall-associated NlpC family hydrolase|nr:NlpC/P60 family protein [Acidimicrobiales bacterium]